MSNARNDELRSMLINMRDQLQLQVEKKKKAIREGPYVLDLRRPDMSSDNGVSSLDDIEFILLDMDKDKLSKINEAFKLLEDGKYGYCNDCEEEIGEKRLRALPFASRCIRCEQDLESARLKERHNPRLFELK